MTKSRNVNAEFRGAEYDELEFVKNRLRYRNYTDVMRECVRRVARSLHSIPDVEHSILVDSPIAYKIIGQDGD